MGSFSGIVTNITRETVTVRKYRKYTAELRIELEDHEETYRCTDHLLTRKCLGWIHEFKQYQKDQWRIFDDGEISIVSCKHTG